MNLDKYLVISGVPGVHKLVSTRTNGLVIEDRKEGKVRFVPVRQQQVTPLATVSMYTETEEGSLPLADVFQKMLDKHGGSAPVSVDAHSDELRAYFSEVFPEHDRDQVRIADIKKCIKWFNFMVENGIFEEIERDAEAEKEAAAETETNADTEAKEPAPEEPASEEPEIQNPESDKDDV